MNEASATVTNWAPVPWREWADSLTTLHMWTQIVGKVRLALTPPASHWGHIPLYVTARGLTTSSMPCGSRSCQIDFDLVAHRLHVTESGGREAVLELGAEPVAEFYQRVMAALRSLDVDVSIRRTPVEVEEAIPFDEDRVHASYDADHVRAFWTALAQAHRLLTAFTGRFVGKVSPVGFFWGSFDLAASRFSGRRAPRHPGGAPNCPPWVMEEAYSHELSSAGWWPLSREHGPAFYTYQYPEPAGYREGTIRPAAAFYDAVLGEYILRHEDVRQVARPDEAVMAFLEDTYALGADLAGWPRSALEPASYPADGRPDRAWSTTTSDLCAPEDEADAAARPGGTADDQGARQATGVDRKRPQLGQAPAEAAPEPRAQGAAEDPGSSRG